MVKIALLQTDKIISNINLMEKFLKKIIKENLEVNTIIQTKTHIMTKRKIYGSVMEVK